MRPAIFFDRDGTLNEEVGYAGRAEDFHIYPVAAAAVHRVNQAGWAAILVTNQAGVARGLFPETAVLDLHALLRAHLASAGAGLDGVYYCPHHPEGALAEYARVCDCRKPRPGMLLRAAADLDLDLGASWVIGDRRMDIAMAHAVGARAALVKTGYGARELGDGEAFPAPPDAIADDVLAAVAYILHRGAR
jgi:D-glycero-D-manno-heptose 1,7-bisphosphate phosphatase